MSIDGLMAHLSMGEDVGHDTIKELALSFCLQHEDDCSRDAAAYHLIGAYVAEREAEEGMPDVEMMESEDAEKLYIKVSAKIYGDDECISWPDVLPWGNRYTYPKDFIIDLARLVAGKWSAKRRAIRRYALQRMQGGA